MRAVFLDYATVSTGDLETAGLTAIMPGLEFRALTTPAQIPEQLHDAEIILLNKVVLTRAHLESARKLKLIALAATGTDNLDLATARERSVAVCNVRDYCTNSVTQQVWALILSLTQHVGEYSRLAREDWWFENERHPVLRFSIRELAGRSLGIVGWGALGQSVAAIAPAFGMKVIIANRPGGAREPARIDLDDLLAAADVVSLHCPLTPATRGLIGARELGLMRPNALLVNTARGGLIDSVALATALKTGRLGGAGIDVLPQEPPTVGDPLLDPELPNLIVTPHIAWAAREARQRCLDEMAANVRDYLAGGRRGRVA